MRLVDDDQMLAEQRGFYRARAPEYDDWWQRRGRYDHGSEDRYEWDAQVGVLEGALHAFSATGDVLELAGGTGWWTERLARTAGNLTVVDSSPEMLAINQARLRRADVDFVAADLFDWQPSRRYDVVFFSFWLSHVPRPRFAAFWDLVRSCLAPDGRAFFIDNRNDPQGSSRIKDPFVIEHGPDLHLRRLSDGTEWRVVKVMYEPEELHTLLTDAGWSSRVDATRWFIYGEARPLRELLPSPR